MADLRFTHTRPEFQKCGGGAKDFHVAGVSTMLGAADDMTDEHPSGQRAPDGRNAFNQNGRSVIQQTGLWNRAARIRSFTVLRSNFTSF